MSTPAHFPERVADIAAQAKMPKRVAFLDDPSLFWFLSIFANERKMLYTAVITCGFCNSQQPVEFTARRDYGAIVDALGYMYDIVESLVDARSPDYRIPEGRYAIWRIAETENPHLVDLCHSYPAIHPIHQAAKAEMDRRLHRQTMPLPGLEDKA